MSGFRACGFADADGMGAGCQAGTTFNIVGVTLQQLCNDKYTPDALLGQVLPQSNS